MTVIGRDRPGLVECLATLIAESGGNWLESRMSRLGGEFAGILRLTIPEDRECELRQRLEALGPSGLTVLVRTDELVQPAPSRLVHLELLGHDRPGIVKQIAAVLAGRNANVEELVTECVSAPMSGETLFKASAVVALPQGCEIADLQAQFERLAADLLVEISLQPAAPSA